MKVPDILEEVLKAENYSTLLRSQQLTPSQVQDIIADRLPKLAPYPEALDSLLHDPQDFSALQKLIGMYQQLAGRMEEVAQQHNFKSRTVPETIEAVSKKVTRAALARRHEKNQEEMRKDQIFIRLTPKSQGCIQFMLCNRNFPRMEVKLSCNQHLEYLVNYLTNKWIRGKVGVKVVLYPDSTFLKSIALSEKEKSLKEPLNNYLMFTDIMTCCGVNQNGVLNMTYEIVEAKKSTARPLAPTSSQQTPAKANYQESLKLQSMSQPNKFKLSPEKGSKGEEKAEGFPMRSGSPVKYSYKDDFLPEGSYFNKNSNFFANNEESMFGSLGFNFNFGVTANKKDDPLFSLNSNNYFDSYFPELRKSKEHLPTLKAEEEEHSERSQAARSQDRTPRCEQNDSKESSHEKANGVSVKQEDPTKKLGNLMSLLDQIEKEKEGSIPQLGTGGSPEEGNNSNRFKEVKTVNIVKKRAS